MTSTTGLDRVSAIADRRTIGGLVPIVLVLFTLSGATGLMLEIVWSRMLVRLLGATTWGVLAVLVSYMGGLGLGSWLLGRRVGKSPRPLEIYGCLEIAIGLYAVAAPWLFDAIGWAYIGLQRSFGDSPGWVRLVAACLAMTPATILMGGTLPVLSRVVSSCWRWPDRAVGALYALNTAGAVVGCFVTGFLLILALGVVETNYLAAGLDLAIGIVAIGLASRLPIEEHESDPHDTPTESPGSPEGSRMGVLSVLAVALISGFCGLAYEVLWTRGLLAVISDSTTYAFTAMLTSFLAGHALGSGLANRWDRGRNADRSRGWLGLGVAQILAGIGVLGSVPLLVWASRLSHAFSPFNQPGSNFWGTEVPFYFAVSMGVVFLPAACLGAGFPLAARLYIRSVKTIAASTGGLYGSNTLGAIIGAVAATFWLIPNLGTQQSLVILALAQVVIGAVLLVIGPGRRGIAARVYAVVVLAIVAAAGVFLNRATSLDEVYASWETGRLLHVLEGSGATVTVHERKGGNERVIDINGVNVAGTGRVFRTIQKLQGHLPLFLNPNARDVLHIGFGSGGTCRAVSLHENVKTIDVAEISPEVIATSSAWFESIHKGVLNDPRVHVKIADAREEMAVSNKLYDLILSDSVLPRFRGNASLYTRDYFELCSRRLRPGGLFSTWFALHGLSVDDFRGVMNGMQSIFPYVQIWYPNIEPNENIVIIGSKTPIVLDWARFESEIAKPAIAADLADVDLDSRWRLADFYLLGTDSVAKFRAGGRINTDDHPVLEFLAPRTTGRFASWSANFTALVGLHSSIDRDLVGASPTVRSELARWFAATNHKLEGQVLELEAVVRSQGKARPFAQPEIRDLLIQAQREYAACVAINRHDTNARESEERVRKFLAVDRKPQ